MPNSGPPYWSGLRVLIPAGHVSVIIPSRRRTWIVIDAEGVRPCGRMKAWLDSVEHPWRIERAANNSDFCLIFSDGNDCRRCELEFDLAS